ncbi:alpha/beta fold hydrolase [Streptomyces aureus]|uniref:alpha/beta fold hydrolase n=1 Tax=Streptomyces aureus TaxID=193461 RepID=UPI003465634C
MRELFLAGRRAYIRWIELPGVEDGPVRVFVHGLGCTSASDFAHIAAHPALGGGRALLVDLLGYGLSDRPADFDYRMESQAEAVAAVLDHLGLTGVDLVGHSMGGAVTIHLAAARPELVARLVVAEPNLYGAGERSALRWRPRTRTCSWRRGSPGWWQVPTAPTTRPGCASPILWPCTAARSPWSRGARPPPATSSPGSGSPGRTWWGS